MLRLNFKIICFVCSALLLMGCGTARVKRVDAPRIETCLTDPTRNQLACTDKERKQVMRPFSRAHQYVCFPVSEFEAFIGATGDSR